jgi:polyhydroxyalkanoate synthesis regulator phasin
VEAEDPMRRTSNEILMRRYLLGDLPQEERVRFEGEYLADAELFEELASTENDLVDSYVRGELTGGEGRRFELEYFRSPQRREKVEFARALNQVSTLEQQAGRSSLWNKIGSVFSVQHRMPQWALVAAAIVVLASGSWLMLQNQQLRTGLQQALAGQADLRREKDTLRQQIADIEGNPKDQILENQQGSEVSKLNPPMGSEVTLRLTPGIARGAGDQQKVLFLPPSASSVHLQLILDQDEYKIYEAALLTPEREEVSRGKALQSRSIRGRAVVSWRFPAHSIRSGDYIVQLTGRTAIGSQENVGSYSFRVLRR